MLNNGLRSAAIAAVFDLDGTLLDGHVWRGVADYHRSQRINRRWLYALMASHLPLWYLQKLRVLSVERVRYLWTRDMGWTLRGFDQAQARDMFDSIADVYIVPLLRPDVVERLCDHQSKGHQVILLSGAFEGLLAVVGERLGVDKVLGTQLVKRNDRYLGKALPPVCQGKGKLQRLQAYLSESDEAIDLEASFAYADSLTDLSVLEAVGHPVAVYPEEELAALASRRAWPILGRTSRN